eukprot:764923-Hanusia_phi.AAC.17
MPCFSSPREHGIVHVLEIRLAALLRQVILISGDEPESHASDRLRIAALEATITCTDMNLIKALARGRTGNGDDIKQTRRARFHSRKGGDLTPSCFPRAMAALGMRVGRDGRVEEVRHGSPAHMSGAIALGDRILTIDGCKLSRPSDADLLAQSGEDASVALVELLCGDREEERVFVHLVREVREDEGGGREEQEQEQEQEAHKDSVGIGVKVSVKMEEGATKVKIVGLTEGGAADLSQHLMVGDIMLGVDGASLAELSLQQIVKKFEGRPASRTRILVSRDGSIREARLVRTSPLRSQRSLKQFKEFKERIAYLTSPPQPDCCVTSVCTDLVLLLVLNSGWTIKHVGGISGDGKTHWRTTRPDDVVAEINGKVVTDRTSIFDVLFLLDGPAEDEEVSLRLRRKLPYSGNHLEIR